MTQHSIYYIPSENASLYFYFIKKLKLGSFSAQKNIYIFS